jgi:hypothetical protein
MIAKLKVWPETFATSFLRCPKCGKGRLACRKTEVVNGDSRKAQFICRPCKLIIPAIAMMAKPIR